MMSDHVAVADATKRRSRHIQEAFEERTRVIQK
jgi:hypothetical protein